MLLYKGNVEENNIKSEVERTEVIKTFQTHQTDATSTNRTETCETFSATVSVHKYQKTNRFAAV